MNGEIAQYLAGGPELIDRYRYQVTDAARALIEVAMDAVRLGRLGHFNAIPAALLSDAARDYLSDAQWAEKTENWFEVSVAETSRSCKGTRGPLTPADDRLRDSRKTYGEEVAEPAYQLAEYLDQYGRRRRSRLTPPLSFWAAAAAHAHPDQQYDLGDAACDLGLYREAAQLWKNAAGRGHSGAAYHLVTELHAIFPRDRRPASWVVTRMGLDDMGWVARLIEHLRRTDARDQARTLAKRAATHALPPYIPSEDLASLLRELRKLGAGSVRALAERAARQPVLDEARGVCWLLEQLPQVGAYEEQFALARRAGADVLLYDIDDRGPWVSHLVFQLQMLGAHEQADVLAKRAARQVDINNLQAVNLLRRSMRLQSRTPTEHVEALHERIAEEFVLDDPRQAAALLEDLLFHTDRHVEAFAQRIAAEFGLSPSHRAAEVLAQLRGKISEGSDSQMAVRPPIKKVEVATERAPQFEPFRPRPSYMTVSPGQGDRFRFGRKPEDGSPCPAEPWSWSDLD
ncbi:hypothetical protein IU436_29750 [Nocardia farcinica]|uniref:hypothetical protein n=1 Tax=Nocardia farcinica TaxID=37329 RepID=UPI001894D271|nr:hypothetical protein [Nocardia farcinica]MBF6422897.1 hypothetical protein [Nocardia farcinica]MBF6434505.1 hypothetical protein [Nocardia farcinica]MBF6505590.1 hypothetical protein [Nocardia farcinica]